MKKMWEQKCEELSNQFEQVVNGLFSPEIYNYLIARRDELYSKQSDRAAFAELQEVNQLLDSSRIHLDTLSEYRFVLQLTHLSSEEINELLSIENARLNMAEQFDAVVHGYVFDMNRGTNQNSLFQEAADFDLPEEWSEERKQQIQSAIQKASEMYRIDVVEQSGEVAKAKRQSNHTKLTYG
ncbi:MAG: hypothetical protein AAGI23_03265 [Bacteroidota bacterium]